MTDIWAQNTWEQELSKIKTESVIKIRMTKVLKKFGLLKNKVTGESVTKLPQTTEGQFPKGLDISYSKAFSLAYSENSENLPILYLKNLASNFDFENYSESQFEGLIARGLRTLPSLMRDRDFAENLKRLLRSEGYSSVQFKVKANPEEDITQHTDVLLDFRGQPYRIWLYQFSSRGLPHDIERVLGRRGELPKGIHVLCPLKATIAMEKEKLERRKLSFSRRLESKKTKIKKYLNKDCKGARQCLQDAETLKKDISKNDVDLATINSCAEQEICDLNGWYFFADQKVKAVIKKIVELSEERIKPDAYVEVCKTLEGPEKYLGEIRLFSKTD